MKKLSFIKYALLSAFIFLVVVFLMEFLYSLTGKDSVDTIIKSMTSFNYLIRKIIPALVYGFIMAYFLKRKAKK